MNEMMIDLETRDTIPSAIIQSIGAVVWKTVEKDFFVSGDIRPMPGLDYEVVERYYRKPDTKEQEAEGRTQSIATMKWWAEQDIDAFNEAFSTHDRRPIEEVWRDLLLLAAAHGVTRFCVRTVVLESNLSVKNHVPMRPIAGKAHMPVTDCEWQIDLLTAARQKLKRRVG
jgi:hypothetical protein